MSTDSPQDNRLRFPGPTIDFVNEVGLTGGQHDNYPAAGQQARFDWMRMYLIALLANQSSLEEPTEKREGTIWFSLEAMAFLVWSDGDWRHLANFIHLGADNQQRPITLAGFFQTMQTLLGSTPTATFSGRCLTAPQQVITIPQALRAAAGPGAQPLVWINGALVEPRLCELVGTGGVRLGGGAVLNPGDLFSVLLLSVSQAFVYDQEVTV